MTMLNAVVYGMFCSIVVETILINQVALKHTDLILHHYISKIITVALKSASLG